MNNLQIFNSEEFGDIRTVQLNNEIYFVGKDVATALGYANPKNAVPTHVSEEDKLSTQIEYAGQRREVTVINESGLYALIFGSKLELRDSSTGLHQKCFRQSEKQVLIRNQ